MSVPGSLERVVAEHLPALGASPALAPYVAEQVATHIDGLPAHLRLVVGNVERVLSLLPGNSVVGLSGLPGVAEYVRLVRSLTTVVYLAAQERPA